MKKQILNFINKTIAVIAVLLFSFHAVAIADGGCTIRKDNGDGYKTTITSVTKVAGGYQIVLTIRYDGSSGKGLNRFGVEANTGTFSNVSFDIVSGDKVTGTVNLGPQVSGFPFSTGFYIDKITNFGIKGTSGSFTVTYTITSLQDQTVDAEVWQDNGNTKTQDDHADFGSEDFQSVYNCQVGCAMPVLTPAGGTYAVAQTVSMSSTTTGATIYYTTDGSTPTTSSKKYSASITVNANQTINAIAVKSGLSNSDVASESYIIAPVLPTPTMSPSAGNYTTAQNVTLSCSTSGVSIRYTIDGSTPDLTSPIYSSSINITSPTTINAIAVKSGYTNSAVATGFYNVLLPVAAPVFSPQAGNYNTTQSVSITSSTAGASIYYTIDGTTPTTSSTLYTGQVSVDVSKSIKAIAVKTGMANSSVSSSSYIIKCANPTFSPVSGTYNAFQSVALSSITPGVSIRYTTDGSDPSATSGTIYSTPISVTSTGLIKAIAYKTGATSSDVASSNYVISLLKISSPVLSPAQGTYNSYQSVTITCPTDGVTIKYTTDNSDASPTNGTVYTQAIPVNASTVIKTIAYKTGMANSDLVTGSYVIQLLAVDAPSFTPQPGSYNTAQSVAVASTTSGAAIYYTTNGTTPTTSSSLYNGVIAVSQNTTLNAIAVKAGMLNSSVTTGVYNIKCATPSFSITPGSYATTQSVSLSTTTSGATIKYTTDGSQPSSTNGTIYNSAISISATGTLKAVAYKAGMNDSDIASGDYIILLPTAAPQFSPLPGTYNATQNVTITSSVSDATIYYTTNGTDPTSSSPRYSMPVSISATTTLKAYAEKAGMTPSTITSGLYTILAPANDPTFTPAAGTYIGSQSVAITTTSSGAKIRYTTDDSTPTETTGIEYTGPITISANTTIRAIAYGTNYSKSNVVSNQYNIKVSTPELSVLAGTYNLPQSLTITCSTANAKIYYTTDGTDPSATNGTLYTGAISIPVSTNIKVIAINTGMTNSDPKSANYVISLDKLATPIFTPVAGTYAGSQSVTIASAISGVSIVYTLDGTTPSKTNGTVYTVPVIVDANKTLKAYAYKANMLDSDVASGDYKIKPTVTFTPAPGSYTSLQSVALTCSASDVIIRYTTDGTIPSKTIGTIYTAAIALTGNTTLKAIAYKTGVEDGDVVSGDYTFQLTKAASPEFNPVSGTYTDPQSVVLSSTTANAVIRYTTDGTVPTKTTGTVYKDPIAVSTTTTINAITYAPGFSDSDVSQGKYLINLGGLDTDGDGVPDNQDDYPLDPTRAYNNFYPGVGYGSLAYEDNWPYKADYDMNDMVIDYRFNQITNSDNQVVQIKAKLVLRAMGATYHNGFGIELPVLPSQVSSCVATLKNGNPVPVGKLSSIDPVNGLEKNQAKAVVILFDDGYDVLPQIHPGIGVNTDPTVPFVIPDTINLVITFAEPVNSSVFTSAVYNPFMFINKTRNMEVHLPNYPPTSLANTGLFNTGEDTSSPSTQRYYKTSNNLPWAINIYEGYSYPVEKVAIVTAFLHFAEWAQSGGVSYPDWYKDLSGYRVASNIYTNK